MIHMLISAISGKCTRNNNRTLITLPVLIVVRGLFRVMVGLIRTVKLDRTVCQYKVNGVLNAALYV